MEISKMWKIFPSDVFDLFEERPVDIAFMRAYIRAYYELKAGKSEIKKEPEDIDISEVLLARRVRK